MCGTQAAAKNRLANHHAAEGRAERKAWEVREVRSSANPQRPPRSGLVQQLIMRAGATYQAVRAQFGDRTLHRTPRRLSHFAPARKRRPPFFSLAQVVEIVCSGLAVAKNDVKAGLRRPALCHSCHFEDNGRKGIGRPVLWPEPAPFALARSEKRTPEFWEGIMSAPVLVVGAGPVGLTMAAALTRHGVACRVIDKAAAPSDKSKALVVWSRTLELLDGLGLAETFVQSGLKTHAASVYSEGKRIVHIEIAGVASPFAFPLMIPQSETERLLSEHLARHGVAIDRRVELVSFTERPDAVAGTLRHADGREEPFESPWLIGCDGAHSTVRHTLGMQFTGQAEPNDWFLADVHVDGPLSPDEIGVFWHAKGVLVVFPITPGRFRVIADLGSAEAECRPDPTLADVQAKVDERGPGGLTLADPVWLASFRINERKVSEYRRGRVMLAGDAAHIHSPAGGQGMNTGMQDAFNLAWKLALVQKGQGQAEPLFSSYSIERSAVGDQVLRAAERLTTVATLRNPVAQFLRNHLAPVMSSFGFVQDRIKNALCELSINYRHGPLSAEDWPWSAGGAAAGDRLPDAPLSAGGRRTSLFAAIRDGRHALLLFPHEPASVPHLLQIAEAAKQAFPDVLSPHVIMRADATPVALDIPVWQDVERKVHGQLGVTDRALILVRPDGYIGYRCQPADAAKLLKYLGRYLARKR
jgi:2-polyprenyl-6-methoxyphenol hydroxylase-like FAD-dependent oxidoreductase